MARQTIHAVVRFGTADDAGRPIAGVTAAGRSLRELALAGVGQARIEIADGASLPAAVIADARRLASGLELAGQAFPQASPLLELDGRWLVTPDAIDDFLGGGCAEMAQDGAIVARLSGSGKGGVFDPGPLLRLDGPDADMAVLRGTVKPIDGYVSRFVNRPVSRRISRVLLRIEGARPMHATIGTAVLAIAMFFAIVSGPVWGLVLGGALYQAASIVDGVDGEMARASFRTSKAGASLDSLIDSLTNLGFLVALVIHAARHGPVHAYQAGLWTLTVLPLGLALLGYRALRAGSPLNFDVVKEGRIGTGPKVSTSFIIRLLTAIASRDFYALGFSLLLIAGQVEAILLVYALGVTIWLTLVLIILVRGFTAR